MNFNNLPSLSAAMVEFDNALETLSVHLTSLSLTPHEIQKKLFWKPKKTFTQGLKSTVLWYLNNKIWWEKILMKQYKLKRMGLLK